MLIGLTGLAGAGKDTVADILVDRHGFEKRAFGTALKEVLAKMNPIIGMDLYQPGRMIHLNEGIERYGENAVKNLYPQYRRYLQRFGTEGIRAIDNDFWINAALRDLDESRNYVFTDVRFPNEAATIGSLRGSLWQVDRPGHQAVGGDHVSETWVGRMAEDHLIYNSGSIDRLPAEVEYALGMTHWKKRAA